MSRARANIQDINAFKVNAEKEGEAAEQVNSALQDIDNINAEIDNPITKIEGTLSQCEQAENYINSVVDELQRKYDEVQAKLDALISREPSPAEELITECDYDSEGNIISSYSYWQETAAHSAWASEVASVESELSTVGAKLDTAKSLQDKIQNKIDELTKTIDTLTNIKNKNENFREQLSEYCEEIIDSSQSASNQLKNALAVLDLYLAEMLSIVSSPLCASFSLGNGKTNSTAPQSKGGQGCDEKKSESINRANENKYKNCPVNNGRWRGLRGESEWIPDPEFRPKEKSPSIDKPYSNPEDLTMGEIMGKYGVTGIIFTDGEPSFDEISRATVMIDGFSNSRSDNFDLADAELAKIKGCEPEEVTAWRAANNFTWHECRDMRTMQKVPNEVHANIPHSGGISIINSKK